MVYYKKRTATGYGRTVRRAPMRRRTAYGYGITVPRSVKMARQAVIPQKETKYKDYHMPSLLGISEDNTSGYADNMIQTSLADITAGTGDNNITGHKGRYKKIKIDYILSRTTSHHESLFRLMIVQCKYNSGGAIDQSTFVSTELAKIFESTSGMIYSPLNTTCSESYKVLVDTHVSVSMDVSTYSAQKYHYLQYDFPGRSGVFDISTGQGLVYLITIPLNDQDTGAQTYKAHLRGSFCDF